MRMKTHVTSTTVSGHKAQHYCDHVLCNMPLSVGGIDSPEHNGGDSVDSTKRHSGLFSRVNVSVIFLKQTGKITRGYECTLVKGQSRLDVREYFSLEDRK